MSTGLYYNCCILANCKFCANCCNDVLLNCECCTFAKCVVSCNECVVYVEDCISKNFNFVVSLKCLQSRFGFFFGKFLTVDDYCNFLNLFPTGCCLFPSCVAKYELCADVAVFKHLFEHYSEVCIVPKRFGKCWHCYLCTGLNFETCCGACCEVCLSELGDVDVCTTFNNDCATSCNCKFCALWSNYVCLNNKCCVVTKCVVSCNECVFLADCCICKDCYNVAWFQVEESLFSFRFGKAFAIDATSTNVAATCVTIFVKFVVELVDVNPTIACLGPNHFVQNKFCTVSAVFEHFFDDCSQVSIFPKSCCKGWHCYLRVVCDVKSCGCVCLEVVLCQCGQVDVSTSNDFDCAVFVNCKFCSCWSNDICGYDNLDILTECVVSRNKCVLLFDYGVRKNYYFVVWLNVLQSGFCLTLCEVLAVNCNFECQSATIVTFGIEFVIKFVTCCRNDCLNNDWNTTYGAVRTLCSTVFQTGWSFCRIDNFGMRKFVDCFATLCFLTNGTCVDCFVTVSRACWLYLFGCKSPIAICVVVSPTGCCLCPRLCTKNKLCTSLAISNHFFDNNSQVSVAPKLCCVCRHCYLGVSGNFQTSLCAWSEVISCEVGQIDVSTVCYFDCSAIANCKFCSSWSNDISGYCKCCIWSECVVSRNKCVNAVDCCICKDNYFVVWFEVEKSLLSFLLGVVLSVDCCCTNKTATIETFRTKFAIELVFVNPTICCVGPDFCSKNKCCANFAVCHHGFHDWS